MIQVVDLEKTIVRQKALLQKLQKAVEVEIEGELRYRRYPNGTAVPYRISGSRKNRKRVKLDPLADRETIRILRDKTLALQAIPLLKEHIAKLEASLGFEDFNLYSLCRFLGEEFWESADFFMGRINGRIANPAFDALKERQNTYPYDSRKVTTELGIFRSKSESLEAEYIADTGCRFKYEPRIIVGSKSVCPDFAVERIWRLDIGFVEHLGLIDKPDYREKKLEDIKDMADNGIYPGIQLLILGESRKDGFDAAMAKRLIRGFCMPYMF